MLPSYSRLVLFFVLQGCGFGGFEGGGGTPDPSEWSQMEAMVILPISYLHDIAVKCLVFLSYTPSNSSALCALVVCKTWFYLLLPFHTTLIFTVELCDSQV